jgi:hypothetical protein
MNIFASILAFITAFQNAASQLPQVLDLIEGVIASGEAIINPATPIASAASLTGALSKAAGKANVNLDPHVVAVAVANTVAAKSAPAQQQPAAAAQRVA